MTSRGYIESKWFCRLCWFAFQLLIAFAFQARPWPLTRPWPTPSPVIMIRRVKSNRSIPTSVAQPSVERCELSSWQAFEESQRMLLKLTINRQWVSSKQCGKTIEQFHLLSTGPWNRIRILNSYCSLQSGLNFKNKCLTDAPLMAAKHLLRHGVIFISLSLSESLIRP